MPIKLFTLSRKKVKDLEERKFHDPDKPISTRSHGLRIDIIQTLATAGPVKSLDHVRVEGEFEDGYWTEVLMNFF